MQVVGLLFVAPLLLIALGFGLYGKSKEAGRTLVTAGLFIYALMVWLVGAFFVMFVSNAPILYITLLTVAVAAVFLAAAFAVWGKLRRRVFWLPLACAGVLCVIVGGARMGYSAYTNSLATVGESSGLLWEYAPYEEGSKVALLDEPATLSFVADEPLPRMDGATALYPVYAAFARAVYPANELNNIDAKDSELLQCNKTPDAYSRLINGEADVIFVAGASEKQKEVAASLGVELTFTPIGREAFVFFVNAQNPVESLQVEQVQGIYSGSITSWNQLGANLGSIRAFQRDEDSGSQTALQKLMQGHTLVDPPVEDRVGGMGGIITRTADYRNHKNAIGFSFRFYSTQMVANNQIKLLALDGIAPTKENIQNGSYPVVAEFYAVTTQHVTQNTQRLVEWARGEQGQQLVQRTGYVTLK